MQLAALHAGLVLHLCLAAQAMLAKAAFDGMSVLLCKSPLQASSALTQMFCVSVNMCLQGFVVYAFDRQGPLPQLQLLSFAQCCRDCVLHVCGHRLSSSCKAHGARLVSSKIEQAGLTLASSAHAPQTRMTHNTHEDNVQGIGSARRSAAASGRP